MTLARFACLCFLIWVRNSFMFISPLWNFSSPHLKTDVQRPNWHVRTLCPKRKWQFLQISYQHEGQTSPFPISLVYIFFVLKALNSFLFFVNLLLWFWDIALKWRLLTSIVLRFCLCAQCRDFTEFWSLVSQDSSPHRSTLLNLRTAL